MNVNLTEKQINFILYSVDRHTHDVYDDPEAYGYDPDDYSGESEMIEQIEKDITEIKQLNSMLMN